MRGKGGAPSPPPPLPSAIHSLAPSSATVAYMNTSMWVTASAAGRLGAIPRGGTLGRQPKGRAEAERDGGHPSIQRQENPIDGGGGRIVVSRSVHMCQKENGRCGYDGPRGGGGERENRNEGPRKTH